MRVLALRTLLLALLFCVSFLILGHFRISGEAWVLSAHQFEAVGDYVILPLGGFCATSWYRLRTSYTRKFRTIPKSDKIRLLI